MQIASAMMTSKMMPMTVKMVVRTSMIIASFLSFPNPSDSIIAVCQSICPARHDARDARKWGRGIPYLTVPLSRFEVGDLAGRRS